MVMIKKILVVRNDKIGDFVLALPAIQIIKKAFPSATVTALVPNYTKEIAQSFQWIDEVIIDPKNTNTKKAFARTLKEHRFDAVICLFSDTYNATLVRQAHIPIRVAPATKLVQFLYTHTLRQRRSTSSKPEFEYNLDLARYFIAVLGGEVQKTETPFFVYSPQTLNLQRDTLQSLGIDTQRKLCFVHPVTGGSSNTLVIKQWVALIQCLNTLDTFHFVVTAGPGEAPISQSLVDALQGVVKHVTLYDKNDGVADFMCSIATADLFIAGSTGPLHIAGAMDVPTIGFYPSRRSATPLRWKTLNSEGRWLPFSPSGEEDSLANLDIANTFSDITSWYTNLAKEG
ncbi:glycosyltransferase family 9 protein [Marinomonas sp. IMCC 4694]|uniref:glycosyltransferase family 9 protein n=1 Tax=Marinomonas sp. IMCC 4694 TaxID=2605432 RepID=UPI0011E72BEB|nr:glycosyltransferase family 9 protein [Marinomonas sp. IMCC 4694]TYL48509.1 glycosyltransferase family 9 protein [Marinomonas sp. IMCC 4694]